MKEKIHILDILPENWRVKLTKEEKEELRKEVLRRFKSIAEFNRHYGISKDFLSGRGAIKVGKFRKILKDFGIYEKWKKRPLAYGPYSRREKLKVAYITPEMAYFFGFLYGDGWIQRIGDRVTLRITQSLVNEKQLKRLRESFALFYPKKLREYRRTTSSILAGNKISSESIIFSVNSPLLGYIYEYLTKDNLTNLFGLDDEALKAFVAGALDSDGCVSIKRSDKGEVVHVEFLLSNDIRKDNAFAMLLRRFDVYARIVRDKRENVNRIQITSREDVKNLLEAVKSYSIKVKEIPEVKRLISSKSDKLPSEPVKEIARRIREEIPASILLKKGLWSIIYEYSKGIRVPTRKQIHKLLERLSDYLSPEIKFKLEILARRDYFLDEIVEVGRIPYEGHVYDLYVPVYHNFVAEGIIVHNCIDEIDKMSDRDRSSIHEALEQQTVSISKAGITATLNARTTVIAAANPKYGRFNRMKPLPEQVDLPPTLLSRFDLIFVLLDEPDEKLDSEIAEHILKVRKGEAEAITPKIPHDLIKKYIAYARKNIKPVLSKEAMEEIKRYYVKMRRTVGRGGDEEGIKPIPITARQLEALIRLSEAHAKMRLSEIVTKEDARAAIELMEYTLRKTAMDEEGNIDVSILEIGKSSKKINKMDKILNIIKELQDLEDYGAPREEIIKEASKHGIGKSEVEKILEELKANSMIYEPRSGYYKVL
ncbi:MAG: replicative helicase Mcm [Thermococcaceae archaeon]|nr:replicative helicase Mcm [Thermococcaceae archaeon]